MVSVNGGSQILVLTSKTWNNYKGAPLHAFCCTKKGFKVPQIAPWSFVKIWTKNITPHVLVHCAAIFQRICKCHTISESWDQALSGIEAHLSEKSATNEKSSPEKLNMNMPYLLMSNSDQKSYFLKKTLVDIDILVSKKKFVEWGLLSPLSKLIFWNKHPREKI